MISQSANVVGEQTARRFLTCCVTECWTYCQTKRLDRVDMCDAGNCWWRKIDGFSTSWCYEDYLNGLAVIKNKIAFIGPSFYIINHSRTRLLVCSWDNKICIICILMHCVSSFDWMQKCRNNISTWLNLE